MSYMATKKFSLTPADVCLILESAAKAWVTELKFGALHVKFRGSGTGETKAAQNLGQPPVTAAEIADTHQKIADDALVQDELGIRESQLAQMLIENPMEAERLMAEGDLIDDTTHGSGAEET